MPPLAPQNSSCLSNHITETDTSFTMGQNTSCIQGIPDWVGPYEKSDKLSSMTSGNSKEFYDRLQQLLSIGIDTKDYTAIEEFLLSSANKENTSSLKHEKCQNVKDTVTPVKTPLKIEEILTNSLRKEMSCKSVNFSDKPKDLKVVNVKPVIVRKDCAVHGTEHKCGAHSSGQVDQSHQLQANCHKNVHRVYLKATTENSTSQKSNVINRPLTSHSSNVRTKIISPSDVNSSHRPFPSPPPYGFHASQLSHVLAPKSILPPQQITRTKNAPNFEAKTSPVLHLNSSPTNNSQKQINSEEQDLKNSVESPWTGDDVNDFIKEWLKDLTSSARQPIYSPGLLAANEVQSAKDAIKRLEDKAESIVETFCVVSKHLEHCDWSRFSKCVGKLCDDIHKVLVDYISLKPADIMEIKVKNHVTQALNKLSSHITDSKKMPRDDKCQDLWPLLKQLGDALHKLMEFLISKELKVIVKSIQKETNSYHVQIALCTLAEIAATGGFMAEIIAKIGGTKQLLNFCQTDCSSELKTIALRILTLLSGNLNNPLEFEMERYLGCIAPILANREIEEQTKCEALALLLTILQHSENSSTKLTTYGNPNMLVTSLNELIQTCVSSELSLLSKAAIKIITARDPEAPHILSTQKLEIKSRSAGSKQESYV